MTDNIVDIHTHNLLAPSPAVISVGPDFDLDPSRIYSVGIHPWHSGLVDTRMLRLLDLKAQSPNVVAIGETGLDTLRGAPLDRQAQLLQHHIELSEQLGKPLVLHIVRAFNQIMALRRSISPSQPWIIHGFRGKPRLATQLLGCGFHISLGERFNPATAAIISADRLHFETDESQLPIDTIASRILSHRNT